MTYVVDILSLRILLFVLLQDIQHVRGLQIRSERVELLIILDDLELQAGMVSTIHQMQEVLCLLYQLDHTCQDWESVNIDYLLVPL